MNVFQRIKKGFDTASKAQLLADENAKLSVAAERHEHLREQVQRDTEALFQQRQGSVKVIEIVETYVNQLANSPTEFDKTVAECILQADRFREDVQKHEPEAARVAKVRAATGATVAGAGAAVAALGPSAAMAIATTFGTASTAAAGILGDLATLWKDAPSDYGAFGDASKERLAAVINHARTLGELLHQRVMA